MYKISVAIYKSNYLKNKMLTESKLLQTYVYSTAVQEDKADLNVLQRKASKAFKMYEHLRPEKSFANRARSYRTFTRLLKLFCEWMDTGPFCALSGTFACHVRFLRQARTD